MPYSNNKTPFIYLNRNLSWNFIGQFIGKASLMLFHIVFANLVGLQKYGEFSFVFVGGLILFQPVLDLGLSQLITKWISRGNTDVIKSSFSIKVVVSSFLTPLVLLLGWWMNINFFLLITLIGFFLFNSLQQSLFSILRGMEDLRPESIISALQNLLAFIVLFFFVLFDFKENWIGSSILMITRIIGTLILSIVLWRNYYSKLKKIVRNKHFLILDTFQLWKEALSLGLVIFLIQFYFRIDTIMLGLMTTESEVGLYNMAYNFLEGTFFIPTIIMSVNFSGLSQEKNFWAYFQKGFSLLTITGFFCCAVLFLFTELIVSSFFAPEFYNVIDIIKKLSFAVPLVFWGYLTTQSLVALDKNRIYLIITSFGLVTNVILNYIFIPKYGASGAAITTIITETLIPLSCFIVIKQHFVKSKTNVS